MCQECNKMMCRVFTVKSESWTGFCSVVRCKVNGIDQCHRPRLPTTPKELDLPLIV